MACVYYCVAISWLMYTEVNPMIIQDDVHCKLRRTLFLNIGNQF
jgi:hypothetical protein